ncbi:MAG: hypothetical protein LAT67_15255 [Balneolales bacterium]|nr:hypothetical protein [Balneolales bacterium]
MNYHALNPRTCGIVKLQQHLIFMQQLVGDSLSYHYDGFELFILIALFEPGEKGFNPNLL